MTHVYLDENLSEYVAQALNFLNKGYFRNIQVFSTKEKFGKGAPDETIIPSIGKEKGILLTKDINIHKTSLQFDLCRKYGLGIFFLAMPKGMDKHWEMVRLLINNWEEIVQKTERERLPFAYRIKIRGRMEKL
jgi:hypothetical protein